MTPSAVAIMERMKEDFARFVAAPDYPCVGARSALRRSGCDVRVYRSMDADDSSRSLAADLRTFGDGTAVADDGGFAALVAIFLEPAPETEMEFETRLWRQLSALAALDEATPPTANRAHDTSDPHYSFGFGGTPYFVIGLHPMSSRLARRLPWPALVFNPHSQFDRLRADGKFESMRRVIRARDVALQGDINPNLADVGERSEAGQYSGRLVEEDWRCPFRKPAP
jgi:FPC/CPF motif-containing protein YcgG